MLRAFPCLALSVVSVCLFEASTLATPAKIVKLAYVIAPRIDPSNGFQATPTEHTIRQPDDTNEYHLSDVPFVDGVFIPDGGAGAVTLDSQGNVYQGFPDTDSRTWDPILPGPPANAKGGLGGVDYSGPNGK